MSQVWSVLIYIRWLLKKSAYSAAIEWNILHISIRSCLLMALLSSLVCSLIFLSESVSIVERRMLNLPVFEDLSFFFQFYQCLLHIFCSLHSYLWGEFLTDSICRHTHITHCMFLILSANPCLLNAVFRPFKFKWIIDLLGLKSAILFYLFCLFSLFWISIFPFFPSMELLVLLLAFYFYLSMVLLSISHCTAFLVVALGITQYIYNITVFWCWYFIKWSIETLVPFTSFSSPNYNIIFIYVSPIHILNPIRQGHDLSFDLENLRGEEKSIIFTYIFGCCILPSFLSNDPRFFHHFLSLEEHFLKPFF